MLISLRNSLLVAALVCAGFVQAADLDKGKEINGTCAACHSDNGQGGKKGEYPRIAGQQIKYIETQLRNFRARTRVNIPMFPYTQERELSDEDIKDISAYLAGIKLDTKMPTYTGTEDALTRLSRAGARIEHRKIAIVSEAMSLAGILFTAEAYGIWAKTIEAAPEKMFPRILERFRSGGQFKAMDYVSAWRRLHDLRRIWADETAGYDAVLLPTSPILPPHAHRLMTEDEYYITENLLSLRNTRIGNLMGLCALTLPTAQPSCGISFMAGPGQEERLLRLGVAAERALA